MGMETQVLITRDARKGFEKAPSQVQKKFLDWVGSVQAFGLEEVRMAPGFHDEPLTGKRKGQRSVRLNK